MSAKAVKSMAQYVLHRSGLTHLPFYPRRIEDSQHGDRVQLPLRINRNSSKRSVFVRTLEQFDPERYDETPDFSILEEVDPVNSDWVDGWVRGTS